MMDDLAVLALSVFALLAWAATVAWVTFLPAVGLLWLFGWLA